MLSIGETLTQQGPSNTNPLYGQSKSKIDQVNFKTQNGEHDIFSLQLFNPQSF